ncbi:hypothetical protein [Oceaniferula spumae]
MKLPSLPSWFVVALTAGLLCGTSQAVVYLWTGAAANGNWNDSGNWDSNGIPPDTAPANNIDANGFNLHPDHQVRFSSTTMPTTNIPSLGGGNSANNRATPTLILDSGGVLNMNLSAARDDGVWTQSGNRTVFTIGDGIGPAGDTTLNLSIAGSLNRHNNGITHTYLVNSDGVFTIAGNGALAYSFNDSRFTQIILDGGTFDTNRSINRFTTNNNFVDFLAIGSSFTAHFGNSFGNMGAVQGQIGTNTFFRSSNDVLLMAVDNGNDTFTVTAIPEPSSAILALSGLMTLVFARRRK